ADLRRCLGIAPGIDEKLQCRGERRRVSSRCLDQSLLTAAIDFYAVNITADRTPLGAGKVDPPSRFVDTMNRADFPFSGRHRLNEFAVGRVVIEMLPAATFARPEK